MKWRAALLSAPVLLGVLAVLVFFPQTAQADSEIQMAGGGVSEAPGTLNWAFPTRITADDNSDTLTGRVEDTDSTQRLRSTSHGFSIPLEATIDGIEVEVEERDTEGNNECEDIEARLTRAGSPVGADRFSNPWPSSRTVIVRGGATDLWGTTWTPSDINGAGFGFALRADEIGGGRCEPEVDFVRITVFYTPSPNAKYFRTGTPADNGEISEPATYLDRLDLAGSGPSCTAQTINPGGDSIKAYDIKQAVTYAAGDWTVVLDWDLDNRDSFTARVVITNAVGAEQSTVVDFGASIVTQGPSSDQTLTVNKGTSTTLLATERLAVFIIHDQDESFSLRIGNFDTSCNSRLVTPDLVVSGCDALTVTTSDPAGQLWFNETVEPDGIALTTQFNVSASFQTGATPALSVTNDGSGTCDITIRLLSNPGVGRSMKFNTTDSAPWPADISKEVPLDPSIVTACASVASGGTCDIWLWADYESAWGGQAVLDIRVESE